VGRQWFWEVRYPGHGVTTANEIHIPARTRVNLVARTADVIHSFWVPKLNRKIDMIPGQTNRILLYADKPGAYRGQCAEFCGMQHANMALEVYADPPARFNAWLAHEARPAPPPTGAAASSGQKVFLGYPCSSCHTLRGSGAKGQIGPDLTHLASRRTLAALTIPNDPHDLARWIQKPQTVKPGNKMPGLKLSSRELRELIAFLEQTR
jgi:cytochrome c oxidase subunit II